LVAETARDIARRAWLFRLGVEREAAVRFARLTADLVELGAASALVDLASRAAEDEQRHARICAEQAARCGEPPPAGVPVRLADIAPEGLYPRGRVLYEIVAACCITETESMGVLTTLLGRARHGEMRRVLRELAEDEVRHSRLGWAHLASEHARGVTSFLAPLIPRMLSGTVTPDLFRASPPEEDEEALLDHGVLPHRLKREVFVRTLEEVVFPGLETFGVDAGAARAWLAVRRAELARSAGG
jgi:hypothetical protein